MNVFDSMAKGAAFSHSIADRVRQGQTRNAFEQYAPAAMRGDQNALGQLAAIDPGTAIKMQNAFDTRQATAAKSQESQRKAALQRLGIQAQALYGARDQADFENRKQALVGMDMLTADEAAKATWEGRDALIGAFQSIEQQIAGQQDLRDYAEGKRRWDTTHQEGVFRDRRDYSRGVVESDRGYDRGVLESDRTHNRQVSRDRIGDEQWQATHDRGVYESDRAFTDMSAYQKAQNAVAQANAESSRLRASRPDTVVNVDARSDFKVPKDFMRDPNDPGAVIPIPGGPADIEARNVADAAAAAQRNKSQQSDVVTEDVGRAIAIVEANDWGLANPVTGGFGALMRHVPGTDAHDLKELLITIKGNAGFDKLQAMREASPTGGALGQVSNVELNQLNAAIGSLEQSQSQPQLLFNLRRVGRIYDEIINGPPGDDAYAVPGGQSKAVQRLRFNAETGEIE